MYHSVLNVHFHSSSEWISACHWKDMWYAFFILSPTGCVCIVWCYTEVIILRGGETILPLPIENRVLTELPFLSHVVVVGEKRPYLTCLMTLSVCPLHTLSVCSLYTLSLYVPSTLSLCMFPLHSLSVCSLYTLSVCPLYTLSVCSLYTLSVCPLYTLSVCVMFPIVHSH